MQIGAIIGISLCFLIVIAGAIYVMVGGGNSQAGEPNEPEEELYEAGAGSIKLYEDPECKEVEGKFQAVSVWGKQTGLTKEDVESKKNVFSRSGADDAKFGKVCCIKKEGSMVGSGTFGPDDEEFDMKFNEDEYKFDTCPEKYDLKFKYMSV